MIFYALASFSAFIICLILGIRVYSNQKENILYKRFAIATIVMGIWCLFPLVTFISGKYGRALFFGRIIYAAAIITPPAFLHFIFTLIGIEKRKRYLIALSYVLGLPFFILLPLPIFIKDVYKINYHYTVMPGAFFHAFVIYFAILCFCTIYEAYNIYSISSGYKRNQLKYLFVAFVGAYIGGILHFLPAYIKRPEPFPHDFCIIFYVVVLTYAIVKHHLMNIKVAFTRAGIFLFVYSVILGVPFLILYYTDSGFVATSFAVILATGGPLIYRFIQKKAEDILLSEQRYYHKALLKAGKVMVKEHDLDKLLKFITDIIKWTINIEFAGVFLKDKSGYRYKLKTMQGYKCFPRRLTFSNRHPLVQMLKKRKISLHMDNIEPLMNVVLDKPIHLIIPLFMENNLLGFLALGEKKDHTFYTEDDINVFEILSRQAVLAIDHCIFMDEFTKAQEKIFQAEKLASIGGMADGVAHQMKNRLNLFSMVSGEMKCEVNDFMDKHSQLIEQYPDLRRHCEYLSETGDMLVNNVRKTNRIIEGILNFARQKEKGTYYGHFSLKEIVDSSLGLLMIKHHIQEFPLEVVVNSSDDLIYGVKSQFMECIYNLLDNCYEAIKEKQDFQLNEDEKRRFRPLIILKVIQNEETTRIEISDNGIGIKEENRRKIFAPFFTTKSSHISGTGIGMFVVKRIIEENHNGKISFKSKYKEGTQFFIQIPRKKYELVNN